VTESMTDTEATETAEPVTEAVAPEPTEPTEPSAPTAPAGTAESTEPATPAPATPRVPRSLPRTERPIQTVGRRKEAIVRVRIIPGSGSFTLNGRTLEAYFPSKVHQQVVREPLTLADRVDTLDVIANLRGGGVTGQAGALRLAIARALIELDGDDRPALKKAGFLTRDARVKESKKYGLKKARKAPQYSKR
jgi:small subunit ribosomal protein S9